MSVLYEKVCKNIALILLNRPEKRNALNLSMIAALRDILKKVDEDPDTSVAIISGCGGQFCSGLDLNLIVDRQTGRPDLHNIQRALLPLGTRLSEKKILIAAIEGHAAGLGYELALRCHFRVGERDARFGFMNRRFAIPIMNGGTVILPRLIGQARALDLIATGRAQPAPEALQYGVLNCIADVGCSIGKATNLARCLAKFDQSALIHDLDSVYQSHALPCRVKELLLLERTRALKFLESCEPLNMAVSFLEGNLGRHGKFDMGNLIQPDPEVTL